jgi:chromosomal replication initiation ATPase DnaA
MTRQLPLPLPHNAAMGADDFLITVSNRDAAAWIEKWPDWPSPGLILIGYSGSGKTHLMKLWLARCAGRLVTAAEIGNRNSESLATTRFIAVDDADSIAGNAAAEEGLFHLYNHLNAIKGSLLLTMKHGAGQEDFALPDLKSRLVALPAVALNAPDDVLLQALIVKQFRDRQIALDSGVVSYLAPRIPRDAAGIRDLVERLDVAALSEGRKITVALARKILEDHGKFENI